MRWALVAALALGGCVAAAALGDDAGAPSDASDVDAALDPSCDHDRDGVANGSCLGYDCDDRDPTIHRGADELCDGIDQDCDHRVDEGLLPARFVLDRDGDGYPGSEVSSTTCPPPGAATTSTDCDDSAWTVHPGVHDGAPDGCNGVDDDCNGVVDDDCRCTAPSEACGPLDPADPSGATLLTRGECHPGRQECAGTTWGACGGAVFPVPEHCTDPLDTAPATDEDCDGRIDEWAAPEVPCGCPSYTGGWDPTRVIVGRGMPTRTLGIVITFEDGAAATATAPAFADIGITCVASGADEGAYHVTTTTPALAWLFAPVCEISITLVEADADHAVLDFAFALCG